MSKKMRSPFRPLRAATLAWAVLVIATLLAAHFAHTAQHRQSEAKFAVAGIIITAFAKIWLIGFQFMELKNAPRPLRHAFDLWVIVITSVLLKICLS